MRKYLTGNVVSLCLSPTRRQQESLDSAPRYPLLDFRYHDERVLTIVDLLQCDLRILWKALLRCIREHKGFWLLGRRHCRWIILGIHGDCTRTHSGWQAVAATPFRGRFRTRSGGSRRCDVGDGCGEWIPARSSQQAVCV